MMLAFAIGSSGAARAETAERPTAGHDSANRDHIGESRLSELPWTEIRPRGGQESATLWWLKQLAAIAVQPDHMTESRLAWSVEACSSVCAVTTCGWFAPTSATRSS